MCCCLLTKERERERESVFFFGTLDSHLVSDKVGFPQLPALALIMKYFLSTVVILNTSVFLDHEILLSSTQPGKQDVLQRQDGQ